MGRIETNRDLDVKKINGTSGTIVGKEETFLDRNAKLVPSDETTTAITNMNWVAGHHTVKSLNDLYKIPKFILSQECYADKSGKGSDAIGQLWYVEDKPERGYYMLVNWDNSGNFKTHNTDKPGWSKTNIKSLINEDGNRSTQYMNKDNVYDNIHSITVDGSDNHTYTGWTQKFNYTPSGSNVAFSYSHYIGKDSSINIPVLNSGTTIKHDKDNNGVGNAELAGIVTADQYNSIMNRLKNLENRVMWRSGIYVEDGVQKDDGLNKATYLWTGTLGEFNLLTSKPENTTFIISN